MENKGKTSIGEILGVIISVLTIVGSLGLFVSYFWHKEWFEVIGLPFDLSWIKSELGIISLLNIIYILLFLILALISVLSFYLAIRGCSCLIEKCISLKYTSRIYEKFTFSVSSFTIVGIGSIIIGLLIYLIYHLHFSILPTFLLFLIPSFYLKTYLDQFFKKIREDTEGDIYIWKDIVAFIFLPLVFYILYNPLIYLSLFVISIFSVIISPPSPSKKSLFKFWLMVIGLSLVFSFSIVAIMNEAKRNAGVVIKRIQNKSFIYDPTPLYGLISSESLQRGTVFIENIESAYDSTCISKEECEQKALKDKWFISFGEITLVFTSKNNQTNILILKDGKFLRSVQVKGD